jgi:hypothetical protein
MMMAAMLDESAVYLNRALMAARLCSLLTP